MEIERQIGIYSFGKLSTQRRQEMDLQDRINEILKLDIDGNELLDFSRSDLIYRFLVEEYGWNEVQQSLFQALIDEKPKKDYATIAQVFWFAILDKLDIDRDMAVALINYRCNPYDSPYEDNLAWSITSSLYNLDYANSEYNAFRDEKIINIINKCFNGQISSVITKEHIEN